MLQQIIYYDLFKVNALREREKNHRYTQRDGERKRELHIKRGGLHEDRSVREREWGERKERDIGD